MKGDITKKDFEALEKRVSAIEEKFKSGKSVSQPKRSESLAEFLHQKDLKSSTDTVVCIVYFFEIKQSDEGVTSKDIEAGFRSARHAVPTNISDQLARCAKRGLVQENGKREGKKNWTITNTGIEHVEFLNKV